jgi:hypothetical protein
VNESNAVAYTKYTDEHDPATAMPFDRNIKGSRISAAKSRTMQLGVDGNGSASNQLEQSFAGFSPSSALQRNPVGVTVGNSQRSRQARFAKTASESGRHPAAPQIVSTRMFSMPVVIKRISDCDPDHHILHQLTLQAPLDRSRKTGMVQIVAELGNTAQHGRAARGRWYREPVRGHRHQREKRW